MKRETKSQQSSSKDFTSALEKIASAGSVSSRAAIQASKATKPSLHTRFVYTPAKDREDSR